MYLWLVFVCSYSDVSGSLQGDCMSVVIRNLISNARFNVFFNMSIPISEVEGSLFTVQKMKSFFTTHFETLE